MAQGQTQLAFHSSKLLTTERVQDIDGKDVDFKKYAGKVLLFVNLASQVSDPPTLRRSYATLSVLVRRATCVLKAAALCSAGSRLSTRSWSSYITDIAARAWSCWASRATSLVRAQLAAILLFLNSCLASRNILSFTQGLMWPKVYEI